MFSWSRTARPSSSASRSEPRIGADVVVDQGLNGGEQVIVQGLQAARPGAPVQAAPLPKTMNRS